MADVEEEYIDEKKEFRVIIKREIERNKSKLAQVKGVIEKQFNRTLGNIDNDYVERKYIKYCAECWLKETKDFINTLTVSQSHVVFEEILKSVNNIQHLDQIPTALNHLDHYVLLMEHVTHVKERVEEGIISKFKEISLQQINSHSSCVEKEFVFLEAFVKFLSCSKDLRSIIAELKFKDVHCGKLQFSKFRTLIVRLDVGTYRGSLVALQEAVSGLEKEDDLLLMDTFKDMISAYLKPVHVRETNMDNRTVIEVSGKSIVISEILNQVEKALSAKSKIEDVYFIGGDVIHIDTNLETEVWEGRNIAILTKVVHVHDKVTWNVSGKDNCHIFSSNAGTGEDGHGKQGKDGYPGESGGNVLILVDKIENEENLTIVSNGGKGSKGQDGGDGRDGEDGKGTEKSHIEDAFPPAACFAFNSASQKLIKNLASIKSNVNEMKIEWYYKMNVLPGESSKNNYTTYTENIIEQVTKDIVSGFMGKIFIKGITYQGNEIAFSFSTFARQGFLLYKGSLGKPGGHGGEYGLGGQGGYAGEVTKKNLETMQEFNMVGRGKQGEDGKMGRGGLYGTHGKNGWDIGHLDYAWDMFSSAWPKWYGTDQNSKLSLEFHRASLPDSVWCPYKDSYASIKVSRIEHTKQMKYEERRNTRENSVRQHHAQAVRKKDISTKSILANYSHHLKFMEMATLQNMRSDYERTQQMLFQTIANQNQEQEDKQSIEIERKRNVSFFEQSKTERVKNTILLSLDTTKVKQNVVKIIEELLADHVLSDNWNKLYSVELSILQLRQISTALEKLIAKGHGSQDDTKKRNLKDIETLLIDKYRFATLQEIGKQLPDHQGVTNRTEFTAECAVRYLVEETEKDNIISHGTLGTLNQYLYQDAEEQRAKIVQFCEEELQNPFKEALTRSIEAFVFEVQESEDRYTSLKRYRDEYNSFKQSKETGIKNSYVEIQKEVAKPGHEEARNLWINYFFDKSLRFQLDEEMKKDRNLNTLYKRYNDQIDLQYDWSKCYKDQNFLKKYNDFIRHKGPQSRCYRELLAYVFDIAIRLYGKDQHNRLSLQDDHNRSSENAVHVLCRDNEFKQLKFNENYFLLEAQRREQDKFYGRVLEKIKGLEGIQDFDDYLKTKPFLLFDDTILEGRKDFNEMDDIKQIMEYFPEEEKQQMNFKLEEISSTYVNQKETLHNVLQRFSNDGRHVSCQELCYLIDSILTSKKEDRKERNTFRWIVTAHSQRNWTDELTLLQLENHFKRQLKEKAKWREYMSKIGNKDVLLLFGVKLDQDGTISTKCIDDILYLLSSIPNATVSLDELKLSEWPYALKEKYWSCKLSSLTSWYRSEKLPTASYYLLSIENTYGIALAEELLETLTKKQSKLTPDVLTNILANFHNTKWNLSEEDLRSLKSSDIDKWEQEMQKKFAADKEERKITQLIELIVGNSSTSPEVLKQLPRIKTYVENIEENAKHGKTWDGFREKCAILAQTFLLKKNVPDVEMLALIDRAIELQRKIKLRDTQKLAILALLTNDRNTLAQVSTGEGKSLIVVAAAIMKAFRGEKVDIITSSSVLAKRDAEENRDIYELFRIKVWHNCSEDIEERKQAYSGNQVVYGELSNFQRDYLLDKFYGKNIIGDRNFGNVIVDEVDSMLLDRGNNMLYLSHDIACLDKLESVYIFIWQWISRPAWDVEETSQILNAEVIEEAVLSDLYGLVKKDQLRKLGRDLNEQQTNTVWTRLVEAQILDNRGKLLIENIDDKFNRVILPEFFSYKDRLKYLLVEVVNRERRIHVPNHLRSFIEKHLKSWIKSAITAFFMKTGQDYVVDVDRTGTSSDRNPNIIILDRDTGTDQANSQWDDALHQFLQLKHGCRLSMQSLKAVFISNVSYFKLYRKLYGLTGTLGSQSERNLLKEIHNVDFVTVPTFKTKQFDEHNPILCCDKEAWISQIQGQVKKIIEGMKRSVLIICETVNDVEVLYKAFGGKSAQNVHMYKRDYEAFKIAQGDTKLEQGQIIIATNLAGRGTDIKPSERLRNAGGLHVCLTYLPANIRIEQQAFGRAARSGDRGSGQLIIVDSEGQEYSNSRIIDLRKERDANEVYRISDIKVYYETQITMEEASFRVFKEQYEQLEKNLDDRSVATEIKDILMKSCLDKWAFWLDENSKYMGSLRDEQTKRCFDDTQNMFISKLKTLGSSSSWLPWVRGNPAQMVKLGKYISQIEDEEKSSHLIAIQLFDEVIEREPVFAEAAHYYKAFSLSKLLNKKWKPSEAETKHILVELKEELRKASTLFQEHIKSSTVAAGIIGNIKKKNTESIIQIDAFEEQQKSIANVYSKMSRSIDDILGCAIDPQSFVNRDVNEDLAKTVYEDLLEKGVIKNPRVEQAISEKDLKAISADYGLLVDPLLKFLSQYRGREIIPTEFLNGLKTEISLPSRETFWKLLLDGNVLRKDIKYVVVDKGRFEDINPSLLRSLIMLEKQTLELKDGQILLNPEYVPQQQRTGIVYRKDDFIKSIGVDKYKVLKNEGILSFNRKARLDPSKMKSMVFPCYDSITVEHFIKVNIIKSKADKILAELVERKIAEKKANNAYKLRLKFDEVDQFSFAPYQNIVRGLLSTCFAFRIELQRIETQLNQKVFPIRLHLKAKLHQSLFWDLLEGKIITPSMVAVGDENLEEKLKCTYSQRMTKNEFKHFLSKDKRISQECPEKLYLCLVEKKWITEHNPMQHSQNSPVGCQGDLDFLITCEINNPDRRQKPLNYSTETYHGINMFKSTQIDKEVEKALDKRLCLAKPDTIKNIVSTLKKSSSILNASTVPNFELKPLTEFYGQNDPVNIEDMHVFSLNGLGHLIQLARKRWTFKMLLSATLVAVMGIVQVAIGIALALFSAGINYHAGAAIFYWGMRDLYFAVNAFKSGYFSWEDYRQYKVQSLVKIAATAGFGAATARLFGHKLSEPSFEIGGKKIVQMSEQKQTELKTIAKRITQRATRGVAFTMNNTGTDKIIENSLQALSEEVSSTILSNITQEIERHQISKTLVKAYNTVGEEKTRASNALLKSLLTDNNWVTKLSPFVSNVRRNVIQGMAEFVRKRSKSNNELFFNISTVWADRVSHLVNIKSITGSLLNDLDVKISEQLDGHHTRAGNPGQAPKRVEELGRQTINQWKTILCEEVEPVIMQHIARPILCEGGKLLTKHFEKKSQSAFRPNQQSANFEQFEERKWEYHEKMKMNKEN